jgi:predicted nucleotidyltransferase component of viral defense system
MIPKPVVMSWRQIANWPKDDQVEQDLIISACLVDLYNHKFLKDKIAFRGGTALNKIVFPQALRYSEDIDLNRLDNSPAGPLFDAVKEALGNRFESRPKVKQTDRSVKIIFSYKAISGDTRKLKIEINVRETLPQAKLLEIPYKVESDYFSGDTTIVAFNIEEMIGSKIRALYQRNKGRDLFDLYELSKMSFDWDNIVKSFKTLAIGATRSDFENNLLAKMSNAEFLEDMILLLPINMEYDPNVAHAWFVKVILPKL